MRRFANISALSLLFAVVIAGVLPMHAQDGDFPKRNTARMTVTLRVQGGNKRTPEVNKGDVIIKQGKSPLQVTGWTQASGANAALDLFILLDDASDPVLASQFDDLRAFINAQPSSTRVGASSVGPDCVPLARRSPGLRLQPLLEWCATIWAKVQ